MRRWFRQRLPSHLGSHRVSQRRRFHHETPSNIDTVEVTCASSGSITVDLHNIALHPPSTPLVIYIPPFSPVPGTHPALPRFLHPYPTAVINYRWSAPAPTPEPPTPEEEDYFITPLQWPTPLHDTVTAYAWITENLRPLRNSRRDIYIYSSHAGASIAASLALTESHSHERIAVRGLVAWNGIYNWSMFLPDHRINKPATARSRKLPPQPAEGSALHSLQTEMPNLFRAPVDLFDPFASPSMFFQTAGMLTPQSFSQVSAVTSLLDQLSTSAEAETPSDILSALGAPAKAPRRSGLLFPPRRSTLKLPATLLLHDAAPTVIPKRTTKKSASTVGRRRKAGGHTFEAQALELSGLMRRSLEKLEFKTRMEWDEDFDEVVEAERRVSVVDVGDNESLKLGERGQEVVADWLAERIRL
ncbi:hypothetical protein CCHL11_04387 [Colletotrichum chlorophyti]|uniref:Alpha/beta hydrolase fold-3 domain-containing protein n=1 Tax=Colletotrichum chlorophyti TaxID=708187 RepID=A0A1Q8RM25_9PEZI|nr:hypothetical protein CCHL11_04387 [Colletotrichum chlorophyti]